VRLLPERLGPKLNLSLIVFFVLLGTATGALVFAGFNRTQHDATELSSEGLEAQASETLLTLTEQTSLAGQLIAQKATDDAAAAANYLARANKLGAGVPWDPARLQTGAQGERFDGATTRTTDVLIPNNVALSPAVADDLTDSAVLDSLFPAFMLGNRDAVAMYYISPTGATRYYPPFGLHRGVAPDFDPFSRPGFEEFRSAVTAPTRPVFTAPYADPLQEGLVVTALAPIYQDGVYRGVIGVDIAVPRFVARMDAVEIPDGFAFVLDRSGTIMPSRAAGVVQGAAQDSDNPAFAGILQSMRDGKTGFDRVQIGGEDMIVAYAPLGEFGGSLALASPVDQLTQRAAAVTSSIEEQGNRTVAFILATMLGFFVVGLAATAWFNRRLLLDPIQSLVTGSRAVAAGNYGVRIPIKSSDELGLLADSFNLMIEQIDQGQQRLEQRNRELQAEIAGRVRIEEELRRSEELYRTLARNFPNGTVVLYDRDLRYQIVDGQGLADLGLTKEDLEGRTAYELFSSRVQSIFLPNMSAVFEGRSSVFEIDAANRTFVIYTLPLRNEAGEIFAGMAMTQDITDRKRAEKELAEREAQYRSVFDSVSDGLIITDLEGTNVAVNPAFAEAHGYTVDELMAMHPTGFIHPDDHWMFKEYVATVAGGGTYRCRARDVRKDGSVFPVDVVGKPFVYGDKLHILGVVRDITEQVRTEQLLEQRVDERTREITALLDLSHSITSTLELQHLVALILERTRTIIDYMGASILIREGDEFVILEFDESIETTAPRQTALRFPLREDEPLWKLLYRREPIIIDNTRGDDEMAQSFRRIVGLNIEHPTFDLVNSILLVPLALQDEIVGVMALSHRENGFFTNQHAALAMAVANHAAVAIANARLFERVEQRTRELATLLEVSHNVASTLELDPLLNLLLDQVRTVAEYDRATVLLVEDNEFEVAAVKVDGGDIEGLGAPVGTRYPFDGRWAGARAILTGKPIIIDDVQSDTPEAKAYRSGTRLEVPGALKFRSWMGVPLVQQERVVGLLTLAHRNASYYTDSHAQLAAAIASQAAVAVENARLFTNEEQRTRELSTLLDISHDVASKLELRPLLHLVLEQARAVVEYDRAVATLDEGDVLRVFAVLNADGDTTRAYTPVGTTFPKNVPGGIWERVLSGEPIVVGDITSDEPDAVGVRSVVAGLLAENPDFRSWMAIPLISQNRVLGMLSFMCRDTNFYTERRVRLASAIASQAAVAIENARLFERVEARTRELSALLDVSHTVAATLDLSDLVKLILDQLKIVFDFTGSSLLTVDGDDVVIIESRGAGGRDDAVIVGVRFSIDALRDWWDRLSQGENVVIDDVLGDSVDARVFREALGGLIKTPAFSYIRSWMTVPLLLQDRMIGMLTVSRDEPGYFTSDHARLARAVADQAAIAIENARLYEQAQHFAALEERQRLARELHDSVSQALYGIALGARTARTLLDRDAGKAVEPIDYVLQLAEAGLTEMRALIFELRPESLENEGLVVAIEKQVAATQARYGINVTATLCDEPQVPIDIKEALFRVVQEGLHNTVKHAHASNVEVALAMRDAEIALDIKDDGVGFDTSGSFPGHIGLKSMRERTAKLGGVTEIASQPGAGTEIRVRIPLRSGDGRRSASPPAAAQPRSV